MVILGLMVSVTLVGILAELVPSGIPPPLTKGLGIEESDVGFLVGGSALASAIVAIPLIRTILVLDRKTLLMALLVGFAASNIVVELSSSHPVIIGWRRRRARSFSADGGRTEKPKFLKRYSKGVT